MPRMPKSNCRPLGRHPAADIGAGYADRQDRWVNGAGATETFATNTYEHSWNSWTVAIRYTWAMP